MAEPKSRHFLQRRMFERLRILGMTRAIRDRMGSHRFRLEDLKELAPASESYLTYEGVIDSPSDIPGLGHQLCNLYMLIEEASVLKRGVILPPLYLSPVHNMGVMARSRFEKYYDFSELDNVISNEAYLKMSFDGTKYVSAEEKTGELQQFEEQLIVRRFGDWNFYEAECCLDTPLGIRDGSSLRWKKSRGYQKVKPSARVTDYANKVSSKLGRYVALHLRRGDRAIDPQWDKLTKPEAILNRLRRWIPDGTRLYIGTNERAKAFFDPIRSVYEVYLISDFPEVVALLHKEKDNYMLFSVEEAIMKRAMLSIGTEENRMPLITRYSLLGREDLNSDLA